MILFVLSSLLIDWECSSVLICSSIVTFFPVRFSLAIIYLVPFISISFCIFLLIAWYYFSHWLSFFCIYLRFVELSFVFLESFCVTVLSLILNSILCSSSFPSNSQIALEFLWNVSSMNSISSILFVISLPCFFFLYSLQMSIMPFITFLVLYFNFESASLSFLLQEIFSIFK